MTVSTVRCSIPSSAVRRNTAQEPQKMSRSIVVLPSVPGRRNNAWLGIRETASDCVTEGSGE